MPSSHSSDSSFFASAFFSAGAAVEGAGPPAGTAPGVGAALPAALLAAEAPMLTLPRAFANKPSKRGSTFLPGVLMGALIFAL